MSTFYSTPPSARADRVKPLPDDPMTWSIGLIVELHGLSKAELNGEAAELLGKAAPEEAGALRIAVRVLSSGFKGNIKVSNMQAVRAPSDEAVAECGQIFQQVRQAERIGISTPGSITGEVSCAPYQLPTLRLPDFLPGPMYCTLGRHGDYVAGPSACTVAAECICAHLPRPAGSCACILKTLGSLLPDLNTFDFNRRWKA